MAVPGMYEAAVRMWEGCELHLERLAWQRSVYS
jgi:hypothetical protein